MTALDVSVVIPNYNRTTLLWRALNSIAAQTCKPFEVIVVDDCSHADRLVEIEAVIEHFRGSQNIKLLVNERNSGANYSRNRGIFAAASKYIAFLDSDDLWMPDKLQRQMSEIVKAKQSDNRPILSGTGRYRVNGEGEMIARQLGRNDLTPDRIRRSNFIGTLSSVIVETWVARHINGFNETLPACQDWDFFIRLTDYVQYVGIRDPLCIYVDHEEERITLNNSKRLKAHLFIYKNHIRNFDRSNQAAKWEFYRNIAEDYQMIGNDKKASLFYARHKSIRRKGILTWFIPSAFWFFFYHLKGVPPIKAQRYRRYKKAITTFKRRPSRRKILETDSAVVANLMALPGGIFSKSS
jgi:glycosyltransferase involved in cell wall biosynthesis